MTRRVTRCDAPCNALKLPLLRQEFDTLRTSVEEHARSVEMVRAQVAEESAKLSAVRQEMAYGVGGGNTKQLERELQQVHLL